MRNNFLMLYSVLKHGIIGRWNRAELGGWTHSNTTPAAADLGELAASPPPRITCARKLLATCKPETLSKNLDHLNWMVTVTLRDSNQCRIVVKERCRL